MKRRLILMRHAKSSWKSAAQSDHERPLNKRGKHDAPRVARRFLELDWHPQWVVSSDAQRTRDTFEQIEEELGSEVTVHFTQNLYLAGLAELRAEISEVPSEIECVLALGHNPGWEDAASHLSGTPIIMKTATVALLAGKGKTWSVALSETSRWKLREIIWPREL